MVATTVVDWPDDPVQHRWFDCVAEMGTKAYE
jgi:hypothetical protein